MLEQSPSIFPLGDAAITIDLGNQIDEQLNRKALAIQDQLRALHLPGIKDMIAAYSSVSVFYDPEQVIAGLSSGREDGFKDGAFAAMKKKLSAVWEEVERFATIMPANASSDIALTRIPVCYEEAFGPDQDLLFREKGMTRDDIMRLHISTIYRVYMIGFLPGFPYLGKINPELQIPRKQRPVPVMAGGVGIAGDQTGIYPLNSPGGWQIIGRTPLKLFDPGTSMPVRLKVGDQVQFYPITAATFQELAGQ